MIEQMTIDEVTPAVVINGREYRASNIRKNGSGKKWADVEYYHQDRGWRECQNWDRIERVATLLWEGR